MNEVISKANEAYSPLCPGAGGAGIYIDWCIIDPEIDHGDVIAREEQKRRDVVEYRDFLFFTRYGVICDLLQYRITKNEIYLFYIIIKLAKIMRRPAK